MLNLRIEKNWVKSLCCQVYYLLPPPSFMIKSQGIGTIQKKTIQTINYRIWLNLSDSPYFEWQRVGLFIHLFIMSPANKAEEGIHSRFEPDNSPTARGKKQFTLTQRSISNKTRYFSEKSTLIGGGECIGSQLVLKRNIPRIS